MTSIMLKIHRKETNHSVSKMFLFMFVYNLKVFFNEHILLL